MNVVGKEVGRLITRNVGIVLRDNLVLNLSEKHYPFQNLMPCTRLSLGFSSLLQPVTYYLAATDELYKILA
jgi:hypothetical protein